MPKLKLSEWAHVAEITAAIVIVGSLAYVGLEINQNTRAVQNQSYQFVLGLLQESQQQLAMDADFHRLVMTARESPDEVTAEDWSRYTQFMYPRVGVWEFLFLERLDDAISDRLWDAFEPYFFTMSCTPGYRRFLSENQFGFNQEFYEYVESTALPRCE